LLVIPFPLTHDYYPFHLPFLAEEEHYASWASLGTIAGALIMVGLLIVIVRGFKSKSIYSFAALFFLGTTILVSNLFFPIGVFMNERFMYVPSIAFVIVIAYFFLTYLPQKVKSINLSAIMGFMGLIVLVFSGVTIARSAAWENDGTLALADVETSVGSAKVNMAAGDALIRKIENERDLEVRQELLNQCHEYLTKSLEIYPGYFPPLDLLGKMYFEAGDYDQSIKFYSYCARRKSGDKKFVENIFIIGNKLTQEARFDEAVRAYDTALVFSPNNKVYLLSAAQVAVQKMNNPSVALPYMEKVYTLHPTDVEVAEKLGITYAMLSRFQDAIRILQPLLNDNPQNFSVMKNLGIAYYNSGQVDKGNALIAQSTAIEQGN
jgi:tetratricopeptide (TPR) repeat protein